MLTRFKREDISKIIGQEDGWYNEISLVADVLRTIYITLGWTHMTQDYHRTNSIIEELNEYCLKTLRDFPNRNEATVATAGLSVGMWIDEEGFINVDYHFVII